MYTITIAQWYVGLHARQNQINIAYGRQINYITLHYITANWKVLLMETVGSL